MMTEIAMAIHWSSISASENGFVADGDRQFDLLHSSAEPCLAWLARA
jgi:hypothetical protein